MANWDIVLEDENGEELNYSVITLRMDDNILHEHHFRLIKYLDPAGDTTFNRFMMDDLLADLAALEKTATANSKEINEIIYLANQCKKEAHTYLTFYGD